MGRTTVLLLHAFPLDARMWASTSSALAAAGYDVVAPSLPESADERSLAVWAARLLAELAGDFVPVGVSMGGYLSFELWRQASERIPALGLVDTRATPDSEEARAGREQSIKLLRERGVEALWRAFGPKLLAAEAPVEAVAQARAIALEQRPDRLIAALEAIRGRPDSRPTLATVAVPALVVVGSQDAITPPSDAEEIAAALPGARLVVIEGAGHLTPLERPAVFESALLTFLAEVTS